MNKIDQEIFSVYSGFKKKIKEASNNNKTNECLQLVNELWMFMNRFRNCDLQVYFDEDIYESISFLNKSKLKNKNSIFEEKDIYKMAFIVIDLNDLGGASIPHRFMINNFKWLNNKVKNYFLVTNFFKKELVSTDSDDYLKNTIKPEEIKLLPKELTHEERGKAIQTWLQDNKIDFAVAQLCPSSIYALSSNCVPVTANLSQDCYTFTLGPGFGDITYLISLDQIFKYDFKKVDKDHYSKIIMLPLHTDDQIEKADAINLKDFNLPDNAITSGSTNMWKTFFGDGEILMEGIASLIRKYSFYHHFFIGTPRCLDNLESFLIRNPDLRNNIHFIGPVKNIYRILKSLTFWVNSFPTTGGSNIEIAKLGKPTIDIAINRNLDWHPGDFLTNECIVVTLDEFVSLGSKIIKDKEYRDDLGDYLKNTISREFNKDRLVSERVYKELIKEYKRKLYKTKRMPQINLTEIINYEKRIALYNAYGQKNWEINKQENFLKYCIKHFPEKTFAWIKLIEIYIKNENSNKLISLEKKINNAIEVDYRIKVCLAFGYLKLKNLDKALEIILQTLDLVKLDPIPFKVTSKIYLLLDDEESALKVYKIIDKNINLFKIHEEFSEDGLLNFPLYYDY